MFNHVVVGIDENPGSRDALALARAERRLARGLRVSTERTRATA